MKKININSQKKEFTTLEVFLLVIITLLIGLSIGGLFSKTNIITKEKSISDKNLKEFISNYEYITNNYYTKIDKKKLINSAISGMMKSLDDPYSMYFDEDETDNFTITLDGSYKGIGIQITKLEDNGYMEVLSVFKNSPAFKAGLKVGDKIISIDNKKSSDYTASEFSSLIRNSKNNTFELEILRDDSTIKIKLNKNTVTLDSIVSKSYNLENKKVGYIYIGIFANNTCSQFEKALNKLEKEDIEYLIIDVRGNSGGHLTTVDGILDLFLTSKQIMYQFKQDKKVIPIYGTGKDKKKYEIILLGDESSASASEVLIAGLKENLNSRFIGKKTYGKGTVQEMITLTDGTQYKITTKKWLTPLGNWVNDKKGIEPDEIIELDSKYFTTYDEQDDTQLQSALEYIKSHS